MDETNNLKEAISYYCKILSLPLIKDIFIKEAKKCCKKQNKLSTVFV
ncbi:hypothetical protein [Desulfurella sp.]|nr:hypothetical protein [Desulfurella sp.]